MGKPLALSFKPATAADEQTIASYLPQAHADGSPIQPSELPSSFPGYLIHLSPELTLDGTVLKSAGAFMMGEEVTTRLGYEGPNRSLPPLVTKIVKAGEYHAIGTDLQGMSEQQLRTLKTQLETAKAKLESQDSAQLATLTKHDLTGALLQAGVQSYFALNDTQDRIAAGPAGVVAYRYLSFGTFSTNIQPNLSYGIPLNARLTGMMMDIDRMYRTAMSKDNALDSLRGFVMSQGARQSANEHLIPEQLFDDPATPAKEAEAVSAVKALQLAAQAGQKIFTVTSENLATVLPQLQQKAVILNDVRNAVNAGKTVTISESTISYNGWTGTGYAVIDPETGAGAWLIGGGADGAILIAVGVSIIVAGVGLAIASASVTGGAGVLAAAPIIAPTFLAAAAFILKGIEILSPEDGPAMCGYYQKVISIMIGYFVGIVTAYYLAVLGDFGGVVTGFLASTLIPDPPCYSGSAR